MYYSNKGAEGSEAFEGIFEEPEEPEGAEKVSGHISAAKMILKAEEGGKGWGNGVVSVRAGFEEDAALFWYTERFGKIPQFFSS